MKCLTPLHYQGIYSWEIFIDAEMHFIWNLTMAVAKKRVPVLYWTQAKLKSLLLLYLKTEQHSTAASDTDYYTKDIILEYLQEKRMERLEALENSTHSSIVTTGPNVPGDQAQSKQHYSKSKAKKHLDNRDKRGHDVTAFSKITKNEDYLSWKETFTQLLKNEIMLFFTDPDPKYDYEDITDEHEMELFKRKNTFF